VCARRSSGNRAPWTCFEDDALWKGLRMYGVQYTRIKDNIEELRERSLKAIEVASVWRGS